MQIPCARTGQILICSKPLWFYQKLMDRDCFFPFFLRSLCMKYASYESRSKSVRKGAQCLPMSMPAVRWKLMSMKHNKYVVNQKLEHADTISHLTSLPSTQLFLTLSWRADKGSWSNCAFVKNDQRRCKYLVLGRDRSFWSTPWVASVSVTQKPDFGLR
jgi:hypothetical protein